MPEHTTPAASDTAAWGFLVHFYNSLKPFLPFLLYTTYQCLAILYRLAKH